MKQQKTTKSLPRKPGQKKFTTTGWAVIMFILAFALYANTIPNKYVLDDYGVLRDNWVTKRGVEGIPVLLTTSYRFGVNMFNDNLYRPLSLVMFAVEWEISPDNPHISHFVNVLFFALTCSILFVLLRKLFTGHHPLFPVVITLLWLAHPIHTEVIANIKSRDEIMSVFFMILAFLGFIEYLNRNKLIVFIGGLIAYFLAFLSKEGVVTMLAIFPLAGWYFTTAKTRKNIIASAVMILPAVAYMLIRQAILAKYGQPGSVPVVDNLLMAAPDFSHRIATAILILGKYLLLLAVPYQLVSDYSYNQIPITGWTDPLVWISFLVYAGALAFAGLHLRKKWIVVFGILFYLITLSIYSNIFVLIGSSFGERFQYLPSLGFAIVLGWALIRLFAKTFPSKSAPGITELINQNKILFLVLVFITGLYGIKIVTRNSEWKDQWTLFGNDIKRSPKSAHLRYYWGLTVRDKAKEFENSEEYRRYMKDAVKEFETALSIYPVFPECFHQLGLAWFRLGDNDKALENYEKALKLQPSESVIYSNMGIIYFQRKDYEKAVELYKKAIELDPHYADAHLNLGSMYGILRQFDKSEYHLKKSLEYDPENPNGWYYLGLTYQNMNLADKARECFNESTRLKEQSGKSTTQK